VNQQKERIKTITKLREGGRHEMIAPYYVAVCQAEKVLVRADGVSKIKEHVQTNLKRYCDLIDFSCGGFLVGKPGATATGAVRLVTFGEYAFTGLHLPAQADQKVFTKQEVIDHIAITIPGEETEVLAKKAKQYGVYIAASNLEYDPEWADFFFNSGFIINPKGKIILKYRKTVTNVPVAFHCSVHDLMDAYKDPVTKKYDPFPVVDTEIGRLAIFICADNMAPEIPRVYSIKGAEVLMHLTSGMSTSHGGYGTAPLIVEASLRTRAWDNAVYLVNSNWGPELKGYSPRARISGGSIVYDYMGIELARAEDTNEQVVRAKLDIEACREYRKQYFKNSTTLIRTELYAPYYSKPIYPSNTYLKEGPIDGLLDKRQLGYFDLAKANLEQCRDFYSEKDV